MAQKAELQNMHCFKGVSTCLKGFLLEVEPVKLNKLQDREISHATSYILLFPLTGIPFIIEAMIRSEDALKNPGLLIKNGIEMS